MNAARVSHLHRQLAELDSRRSELEARRSEVQRELADAYAEGEELERRAPRRLSVVPPVAPVDALTVERSRKLLRRAGVVPR